MALTIPGAGGGVAAPPRVIPPRPPGQRRRLWLLAAVMVAALGFLLFQGLSNATLYFKTADEALAERADLGERRFRLEGLVVEGSVSERPATADGAGDREGVVDFTVRGEHGGLVNVVHDGDVPELFEPGIPVVMEGRWDGERYRSDRILVRHTSEYRAENPARVDDYTPDGTPAP